MRDGRYETEKPPGRSGVPGASSRPAETTRQASVALSMTKRYLTSLRCMRS